MPQIAARYDYVDEEGGLLFQVERLVPKGFRQRVPDGDGWAYNLNGTRRVLFRLPAVRAAIEADDWVFVVEGEKDVETLERLGKVATTSPGGAGKWRTEYVESLRGAKVVVIVDNDEVGIRHGLAVACSLDQVAKKLLVYRPADPHKDVTEQIESGHGLRMLVPFDWRAHAPAPAEDDGPSIRVISLSELMATPDADEHDYLLGPLMLKGSRIVVGAHTGEGKTTWGLQALGAILRAEEFLGWKGSGNGTRALVLDAEQGRRTVKRRFVEAGLHELSEKIDLIHEPDGLSLDSSARHVQEVESILASGRYDVVFADPLYKLHRGEANDERRAVDLMRLFDSWRERFGFALVLPMHCRKPQAGQKFSIHDILGSSGYTRGAEVVVGLQRVSRGYAFLYWWKDREGDLGCLNERWGLLFDQERGFRRDPKDLDRTPTRERVRAALFDRPGMLIDELREAVGAKQATIRTALEDIGALHDGARLVVDRRWSLPPTLFDGQEGMEA
jgi:AAA domain